MITPSKQMIARTRNLIPRIGLRILRRSYAVRSEFDSPLAHLPKRHKPWFRWKAMAVFFAAGCAVAYNQTLFDIYESMTRIDENDKHNTELLPMQLEYKLKHLPLYEELAHPKNNLTWYRLQSWENLDHNVLEHESPRVTKEHDYNKASLTTHALNKPGGILIKPVIFHNIITNEGVTFVHVGYRLCGYPFLVHGGMIATLLNETFKRNALLSTKTASSLKDDFMVENLTINYKRPTLANQFLIVKTRPVESEKNSDRVQVLESVVEDKKGRVLVKSSAVIRDTGRASHAIKAEKKGWFR